MSEIDPQEFGELVGTVKRLAAQVDHMATELDSISKQLSKGKGVLVGMVIAAGGLGAGASHLLERLLK